MLPHHKYYKNPLLQSGLQNIVYRSPQGPTSQSVQLTVGSSQSRPHTRSSRRREAKATALSVIFISNLLEVLGFIISSVLAFKLLVDSTGDDLVVTLDAKIHVPAFATPASLPMRQQLF